jgi:hypothetical protein
VTARAEVLPGDECGRVKELIARKYRIDLIFIKPFRSLQAALRHGQPPAQEIALAITPVCAQITQDAVGMALPGIQPAPDASAFAHETR